MDKVIYVNLSMLGVKPTGLGVYARKAANIVFDKFKSVAIAGSYPVPEGVEKISSPNAISLSAGKLAALRRFLWSFSVKTPKGSVVYSPTHHGLGLRSNQIITIHDLIVIRFPLINIPQYLYFKFYIPILLRRCLAVFAVSNTTRLDIHEKYGYPLEKIYVVPNSIDRAKFYPRNGGLIGVNSDDRPFLLMVGAGLPHKNVEEVLLNAHSWMHKYDLKVLSCRGSYKARLLDLVGKLNLNNSVEFYDYVSGEELLDFYQRASALLYPSKWEGFGIPPLEAMACDVPVIVSDIAVHREIFSDAAFYVKLGCAEDWISAIEWVGKENLSKDTSGSVARVLFNFSEQNFSIALVNSLSNFIAPK